MSSETVYSSDLSRPITVMDMAGPTGLNADFLYNFYTPDETINDRGYSTSFSDMFGDSVIIGRGEGVFSINTSVAHSPPGGYTAAKAKIQYAIQREIPRYVTVNIEGISSQVFSKFGTEAVDMNKKLDAMGLVDSTALIKANLGVGQDDSSLSYECNCGKVCHIIVAG